MKKILFCTTALALTLQASPADAGPVAAAFAWVGSTIATGSVAGALLQTAIGMGVSLLSSAILGQEMPESKTKINFDVRMGDEQPLSFIVGDSITAGNRKYLNSWGKNTRFMTEVIEYSSLPQGAEGIFVNEEKGVPVEGVVGYIRNNPNGYNNQDSILEGAEVYEGGYLVGQPYTNLKDEGNRIWVKFVDGTQTEADPLLVELFGEDPDYPWTSKMVGRGKSYAIITTQYDSDTLTSYPSYRIKPIPLPMYDPRLDSTNGGSGAHRWGNRSTYAPSNNLAVIAYNITRGIYFGNEWIWGGKNLPSGRLPIAEWMAAMNACDQIIQTKAGPQKRYRGGGEIMVNMNPADILIQIGRSSNMQYSEVGGRIKPIVGLPGSSALSITDENVIITEGQSFKPFYSLVETKNVINAVYPEPKESWGDKDAPEYQDAEMIAADGGRHLPLGVSFPMVPYNEQVQRLMRSLLKDYRRTRKHNFYLPPEAFELEPGVDTITWTSKRNGYINKRFVVESIEKVRSLNVLVSLREVDNSDYDWSSNWEMPYTIAPVKPFKPYTQVISGLRVDPWIIEGQDGAPRRPGLKVACDGNEVGVKEIHIEGRVLGQDTTIDTIRSFKEPHAWVLQNVLSATTYQIRARLLSERTNKSAWSGWINVNSPNVKLNSNDVEIDQSIIDDLDRFNDWMDQTDVELDNLQNQIDADIARVEGQINAANTLLDSEVLRLENEVLDALNVSKAYADAGILEEQITRQNANDVLVARIDQLTAALVSEDLITDGKFLNGLSSWTVVTPTVTVQNQDPNNASAIIKNMPVPASTVMTFGASIKQTTENFTVTADDALQLRFRVASTASRNVDVTVQWKTQAGANVGTAETQRSVVAGGSVWQKYAARFLPPNTTAKLAEVTIKHASTSGATVYVTDVQVGLINVAIEARVAELEAAKVTMEGSIATNKQEITAKFNENKAAIETEKTARSDADSAMARRVDTLETDNGTNKSAITRIDNTLVEMDQAIASSVETVGAVFGMAEKLKDGAFSQGFKYWGGAIGSARIVQTDPTSTIWYNAEAPTKNILFAYGGGLATGSITSERFPVSPDQAFDFSFMYARNSPNSITPVMRVRWIKPDGNWTLQEVARGTGTGSWLRAAGLNLKAPAGTAQGQVQFAFNDNQWSGRAALLSVRLRQPFEEQASAEIETAKYALTDPNGSLAILRNTVSSNFNSLDGRVKSNATAISQRYTKTETDSAISSGIDSYNSTLTNRLNQKADSTALTALTTRVKNTEEGLVASGNSINKVQAQTDRGTANGLLRISASSGPAGVKSRIGLRAEASAGAETEGAAFFLDAQTNGISRAVFGVERFAIVNGMTKSGVPVVPFRVEGGTVYMDMARIKDLSVDRIKITNGAVSTYEHAYTAGAIAPSRMTSIQQLSYNIGRPGPQIIDLSFTAMSTSGSADFFTARLIRTNAGSSPIVWEYLYVREEQGSSLGRIVNVRFMDMASLSGNIKYGLEFAGNGYSVSKRFLGCLNVYK